MSARAPEPEHEASDAGALAGRISRPLPELGLGDSAAAADLLLATRSVQAATTVPDVVAALAQFVTSIGGRLTTASDKEALPIDLGFGSGPPVLAAADNVSPARMRLEQFLPALAEDARFAVSRLRHLSDLERAADTDSLTGLLTRRRLMRSLAGSRAGDVVCLIDIDDFKTVNDSQGHAAGDQVLAGLGKLVLANVRAVDSAGRYGGDEIVLLLRDSTPTMAVDRLQRIQRDWREAGAGNPTFSGGVAGVHDSGWKAAMARADDAMYAAKARGRDQVVAAPEEQP